MRPLMRPIVTLILGVHVLAHSIFGCCGHAVASTSPTAAAPTPCRCHKIAKPVQTFDKSRQVNVQGSNQSSRSDCNRIGHDQFPSEHHVCLHGTCHWVTTPHVSFAEVLASNIDSGVATLPATPSLLTVPSPMDRVDFAPISAPPLRVHLALNVLLI